MKVTRTAIADVALIEPRVFRDERGAFFESFNRRRWQDAADIDVEFVQDNHSVSAHGVLRGLHYQLRHPQGKLVRVVAGEIFDVAVDLRRSSPTFGRWVGATMSAENHLQMWIPAGFAHGFLALSARAEVLYKTTDYYAPDDERTIAWNDPSIGIDWPLHGAPILSEKDRRGLTLGEAEVFD